MRNRSQKTAETLLLEPTKNKDKTCKPPGQTQEKGVWDAHAKKQNPSRFCAEAIAKLQLEKPLKTKQNPRKTCFGSACEKAEPQQVLCPSHCETAAWKMPKRCFRNPLKTSKNKAKPKKKVLGERMRKSRAPAGFKNKPLLGALPLSEDWTSSGVELWYPRHPCISGGGLDVGGSNYRTSSHRILVHLQWPNPLPKTGTTTSGRVRSTRWMWKFGKWGRVYVC